MVLGFSISNFLLTKIPREGYWVLFSYLLRLKNLTIAKFETTVEKFKMSISDRSVFLAVSSDQKIVALPVRCLIYL